MRVRPSSSSLVLVIVILSCSSSEQLGNAAHTVSKRDSGVHVFMICGFDENEAGGFVPRKYFADVLVSDLQTLISEITLFSPKVYCF